MGLRLPETKGVPRKRGVSGNPLGLGNPIKQQKSSPKGWGYDGLCFCVGNSCQFFRVKDYSITYPWSMPRTSPRDFWFNLKKQQSGGRAGIWFCEFPSLSTSQHNNTKKIPSCNTTVTMAGPPTPPNVPSSEKRV